jgi:hypothetical protein
MRCGIIFEKYLHHQRPPQSFQLKPEPSHDEEPEEKKERGIFTRDLFFDVDFNINPLFFGGRALLFLVLFIGGWKLIFSSVESNYVATSFWHLVNLPFHEAGHIFFRPFGRVMTSLGGSLSQLLMPLICLGVFIIMQRDTFAASVCLWWFGENFLDLAPYINDARSLTLPLLGGNTGRTAPYGFHDWEFILKELGLLRYDHALAQVAQKMGILIMLVALLWAGYILFKQYRNLDL